MDTFVYRLPTEIDKLIEHFKASGIENRNIRQMIDLKHNKQIIIQQ